MTGLASSPGQASLIWELLQAMHRWLCSFEKMQSRNSEHRECQRTGQQRGFYKAEIAGSLVARDFGPATSDAFILSSQDKLGDYSFPGFSRVASPPGIREKSPGDC